MTKEEINEILVSYIETSSEALAILRKYGYLVETAKRLIAECLKDNVVPCPLGFPGSAACCRYGRDIAEYVLSKKLNNYV